MDHHCLANGNTSPWGKHISQSTVIKVKIRYWLRLSTLLLRISINGNKCRKPLQLNRIFSARNRVYLWWVWDRLQTHNQASLLWSNKISRIIRVPSKCSWVLPIELLRKEFRDKWLAGKAEVSNRTRVDRPQKLGTQMILWWGVESLRELVRVEPRIQESSTLDILRKMTVDLRASCKITNRKQWIDQNNQFTQLKVQLSIQRIQMVVMAGI